VKIHSCAASSSANKAFGGSLWRMRFTEADCAATMRRVTPHRATAEIHVVRSEIRLRSSSAKAAVIVKNIRPIELAVFSD